jgi:hypothetical protein
VSEVDLEKVRKFSAASLSRFTIPEDLLRYAQEAQEHLIELTNELEDIRNSEKFILAEDCPQDEKHCGCIPTLKREVERLREALVSCGANDRTPHYEYGDPNRNGKLPGPGKRWNSPREIAHAALAEGGDDG